MGEYIQLASGELFKLGTCEDLFYVSLPALRRMVASGAKEAIGSDSPAEYLNPKHGWRYRFPWPDEAGIGDDYNRAYVVRAPAGLLDLVDHDEIGHSLYPQAWRRPDYGGGYHVVVKTACPLSPTPPDCGEVPYIVEVYEQKQVDGLVWVVCRCPYCGALFRVPPDKAAELVAFLRREYASDAWTLKIAALIEQGYQVTP